MLGILFQIFQASGRKILFVVILLNLLCRTKGPWLGYSVVLAGLCDQWYAHREARFALRMHRIKWSDRNHVIFCAWKAQSILPAQWQVREQISVNKGFGTSGLVFRGYSQSSIAHIAYWHLCFTYCFHQAASWQAYKSTWFLMAVGQAASPSHLQALFISLSDQALVLYSCVHWHLALQCLPGSSAPESVVILSRLCRVACSLTSLLP